MYAVKEIFYTLQGEGANAGPRRRVLPLCRLQSVVRPRAGSRDRRLPILRHGFRRHGRRGRRQVRRRRMSLPRPAARPAGDSGRRPSSCSPAASRCCRSTAADRRRCTCAASRSPSRPTARSPVPRAIDWICVSPKAGDELKQRSGDELKLVYPQAELDPAAVADLDFAHRCLQPMDGPAQDGRQCPSGDRLLQGATRTGACRVQTHKLLGISVRPVPGAGPATTKIP